MKPHTLIITTLIIVIVGLVYIFSPRTQNNELNLAPTPETTSTAQQITSGTPEQSRSRYRVYSQTAFDEAADKKRILFFHAPWCPTCRPADVAFQRDAAMIPESVVLFKTDYDTSSDLKKTYGVTYQHTFVQVDTQGKEVTKWNGGQLTELLANSK